MSLVTANNVAVLGGTITMPLQGIWIADLVLDQPDGTGFDEGTKVAIKAQDGIELDGTVAPARTGDFLDAVHVRVLGGAAGMTKPANLRGYVQPSAFAKDVINGLVSDAGETLSSDSDQNFLGQNLTAWAVSAGSVSAALQILLDLAAPALRWRMTPDGKLRIGSETWPDSDAVYELLESDPTSATTYIKQASPSVYPGQNLPGVGRVSRVEHQILPEYIRSRIWTDIADSDRGITASINSLIAQQTARFDYHALYRYKIASQSADLLTVDVNPIAPNDSFLPGLSKVPVRAGSAIKVQFSQGAEILLGWDGGNPERPYVGLGLSSDGVQRIQMAGNTDAARKGDHSDGGTLTLILTGTTVLTGTYVDPDGVTTPVTSGAALPLKGKLTEGSTKVGLG